MDKTDTEFAGALSGIAEIGPVHGPDSEHGAPSTLHLLFHVGGPKTGSTAMQSLFVDYHEQLSANGVSYYISTDVLAERQEHRARGLDLLSSGNCNDLFDVLMGARELDESTRSDLETLLVPHFNNVESHHKYMILSSENLIQLSSEKLSFLIESAASLAGEVAGRQVEIRFVLVIRDLVSHCISFWAHDVRRFLYSEDVVCYAQSGYNLLLADAVNTFSSFPGVKTTILQYQRAEAMAANLLREAGASKAAALPFVARNTNKSLGAAGLELIRRFGSRLPKGGWEVDSRATRSKHELLWDFGDYLEHSGLEGDVPVASALSEADVASVEEIISSRMSGRGYPLEDDAFIVSGIPLRLNDRRYEHTASLVPVDDRPMHDFFFELADGRRSIPPQQLERQRRYELVRNSGLFDARFYKKNLKTLDLEAMEDCEEILISHYIQHGVKWDISPSLRFDPKWYKNRYPYIKDSDVMEHFILWGEVNGFVGSQRMTCARQFSHPLWQTGVGKASGLSDEQANEISIRFFQAVSIGDWEKATPYYPLMSQVLKSGCDLYTRVCTMHHLAMFNLNRLQRADVAAGQFREAAAEIAAVEVQRRLPMVNELYWSAEFHHGLALRRSGHSSLASMVKEFIRNEIYRNGVGVPSWVEERLHELD